jgi:RND family efflux transporter MFP subunit
LSDIGGLAARRGRRRAIAWLVALAVIGLGGAWVVLNRPWEPKPTIVSVETVILGPASRILAINGRVVPAQQVEISSTIGGRVATVAVEEGDEVSQGGPLLAIDDTQQSAAVAQTRAQVDDARAKLTQAQKDYDRAQALGDSISEKALDDVRFALESARNDLDRIAAQLEQSESLLSEYTVRAPFDGTVLTRGADPGQVVNSATSLFLFAELSTLHGEASVDELYASEVHRGSRIVARPAGHSRTIDGEVIYVSPRVDASTGGRSVRVSIPGANELGLPVGLTVMLNILVEERLDAITIPRTALLDRGLPAVYVIEDAKAVRRPVQFIDWPSDRLIVTSGLSAGDVLIAQSGQVQGDGALVATKE